MKKQRFRKCFRKMPHPHTQFPRSVLITGANRGIGFGLVQELLKHSEVEHIIAGVRNPDKAQALDEITDARVTVVKLDVLCDKSIESAVSQVEKIVGEHGLNALINNAGILNAYIFTDKPDRKKVDEQFLVNSAAPIVVTHFFLPLLRKGANAGSWGFGHSTIVNISSNLGSIQAPGCKGSGSKGYILYKSSKTALNSFTKALAEDLDKDGILVVAVHPGWVLTDMGGKEAEIDIEESASRIVKTLSHLEEKDNGTFINNNGEPMAW